MRFLVQVDSVKQPIKRNSVGSGYMSLCWTSALDDHLDHRFIIFQKCEASHRIEKNSCLRKHNQRCLFQDRCAELVLTWFWVCFLDGVSCGKFPCTFSLDFIDWLEEECNTSRTKCQRSRAGLPSMRRPASREIISDSAELCETGGCFLYIQLIGTNVRLPNMHKILPEVDSHVSLNPSFCL